MRVAIPLAALAAEGRKLPGLPGFVYGPLYGDAHGYYAGAREAISAASRSAIPLGLVLLAAVALAYALQRARCRGAIVALAAGGVIAAAATVVDLEMQSSGATVVGWPLVWAVPLAPMRLLDPDMGPDAAFAAGLALSLLANAATVVATAYVGRWLTGRRAVGLAAAALVALWPFVPGLVVGSKGWQNGMWNVDVGLHLYTEPLSTALVVGAITLLLRPVGSDLSIVLAGLALGYATNVKLTNGLIAAGLVIVLVASGRRRAAAILSGAGLVFAPLLIAHWNKGYVGTYGGDISPSEHPFELSYATRAWTDSLLFTPALLLLLVPLAIVGLASLRNWYHRAIVGVPIAITVVRYSLYDVTPLHPRFFYVVLPLVLALDAAGVVAAVGVARSLRNGSHSVSGESGVPDRR